MQVHRKNNEENRVLYTHLTSVVDTKATQGIIRNGNVLCWFFCWYGRRTYICAHFIVRDSIFRGYLQEASLVWAHIADFVVLRSSVSQCPSDCGAHLRFITLPFISHCYEYWLQSDYEIHDITPPTPLSKHYSNICNTDLCLKIMYDFSPLLSHYFHLFVHVPRPLVSDSLCGLFMVQYAYI